MEELYGQLSLLPTVCPATNIGKANKIVSRIFEEEFKGFSVTTVQFAVLVHIHVMESPGCTELAERLGSDPSTISRIIDTLEGKQLVRTCRGEDRRTCVYCLTDEGSAAIRQALAGWQRANARVIEKIGSDRWQDTLDLLRHLQE